MKYIYGLILSLSVCTLAESSPLHVDIGDAQVQVFRNLVARSVSELVANSLRTYHGPLDDSSNGGKDETTLFPPIKDPVNLDPVNICGLNVTLPGGRVSLMGDLNILEPVVTGLSQLRNAVSFVFNNVTYMWGLDLVLSVPRVDLRSPYMTELMFSDRVGFLDLTGEGEVLFGASDVFFSFHAAGFVPKDEYMELRELEIDFGFKNLMFDPTGLTSEGVPANLSSLASHLQVVFDILWTNDLETQAAVNGMLRCVVEELLSECIISDWNEVDLSCVKDEISEKCLKSQDSSVKEQFVFKTRMCESLETSGTTEGSTITSTIPSTWPTTEASTQPSLPWPYPLVDIDIEINIVINNYN